MAAETYLTRNDANGIGMTSARTRDRLIASVIISSLKSASYTTAYMVLYIVAAAVTLRGDRMYEFVDRLVSVALPRVRDFRGVDLMGANLVDANLSGANLVHANLSGADLVEVLRSGDVVFGNLEGALFDAGGESKRCRNMDACYAFRSPEWYAELLGDMGFNLVSLANNHSGDFLDAGRAECLGDELAVTAHGRTCRGARLLSREAIVARCDGDACCEALDVPFERPRERLVEIIEVEHQFAVRRMVPTEVSQVGVAAELHRQPGVRDGCEVGGHQLGAAPEERERGGQHPAVAQRNEARLARGRLTLERLVGERRLVSRSLERTIAFRNQGP